MSANQKLYIKKNSRIHSSGLFAKTDIKSGSQIIEYRGLKITKAQSDKIADVHIEANKKEGKVGSVYIFTLNQRYDINGKVSWNLAKYINHSCDPNCETDIVRGKIWINAIRDIKKVKNSHMTTVMICTTLKNILVDVDLKIVWGILFEVTFDGV